MKSARKRLLTGFACLLLSLCLTGCSVFDAISPESEIGYADLPEPEKKDIDAPVGDEFDKTVYGASLYYPDAEGEMLHPYTRVVSLDANTQLNRRLCEEILKTPGSDLQAVAPKGSRILFVESASGLVNVCIQPAQAMDEAQLLLLAEALSKTLLAIDDNSGVSLMLSDRAACVNLLPLGVIGRDTDFEAFTSETAADGMAAERRMLAYYPASDDEHLIAESVPVALNPQDPARACLAALAGAPQNLCAVPLRLNCETAFEKPSDYTTLAGGERVLNLYFTESGFAELSKGKHTLNQALAAITLTLTTFLPGTDGVSVHSPLGQVTEIALKDGQKLRFDNGTMKRRDFSGLIGECTEVYFAGEGDMLYAEPRVISLKDTLSVRVRLSLLFEGPVSRKLRSTTPEGITIADILGIRVSGGLAHVNLSAGAYAKCQSFSRVEEELFVYALVNTLCRMEGVSGVRLYVEGEQVDVLTQFIHLEGVLLENPGRVSR